MYTDGLTEAMNEQNELYGEDRVLRVLDGQKAIGKELVNYLLDSGADFVQGAEQSDDITMLTITFK